VGALEGWEAEAARARLKEAARQAPGKSEKVAAERLRSARDELEGKSTAEKEAIIKQHEDELNRRHRARLLEPFDSLGQRCKQLHGEMTKDPRELDTALDDFLAAVRQIVEPAEDPR
jgi:hypothetical protein